MHQRKGFVCLAHTSRQLSSSRVAAVPSKSGMEDRTCHFHPVVSAVNSALRRTRTDSVMQQFEQVTLPWLRVLSRTNVGLNSPSSRSLSIFISFRHFSKRLPYHSHVKPVMCSRYASGMIIGVSCSLSQRCYRLL